jgi:hypothetical protein
MKQLRHLFALLILTTFAQTAVAQTNILQTANTNEKQPYKIIYSNLGFGKADYSKIILNAWKSYDNNTLDDIAVIISDTIKAILPDGTIIKGKENFMSALKAYRGSFASVVSTVASCTTLKSPNVPEEDVTVIWGTETDTKKDGTVQSVWLHELWFFNPQGKVTTFYQFVIPKS